MHLLELTAALAEVSVVPEGELEATQPIIHDHSTVLLALLKVATQYEFVMGISDTDSSSRLPLSREDSISYLYVSVGKF